VFFLIGIIRARSGRVTNGLRTPCWGILTRSIARFLQKYQAFRRQLLCGLNSCQIAVTRPAAKTG
jgi:hypothetical protein